MTGIPAKLVLASHNQGKAREIADLLAPLGVQVVSAAALQLAEPEETEDSFIGNAVLKAEAACAATGLPALADDSGLAVPALNGAPGIYSARWAGPERDFGLAMRTVWEALAPGADRRARFVCALALKRPNQPAETFEGDVWGELVWPPRGDKGFGYDPMFVPHGYAQTFGEMDPEKKHAMSHRARAFAKLVAALG
ncbi:MAG: RdgB/HAM1 family non-canonical purine NTP pyrophosphatase [Alphaproteobacteria bacterium]|nr:RdgB/HAM1 family non-canonical purine NTP pyrophosphatase [Alphaproteobacteria bacterium]